MLGPRALVSLTVFAIGCSGKPSPSKDWCASYVAAARQTAASDVKGLADATAAVREHDADDLLSLVAYDAANEVVVNVCADAHGDSLAQAEARKKRIIDLGHAVSEVVLSGRDGLHAAPMAAPKVAEVQRSVDDLIDAFSSAAGTSTRRGP